MILSSEHNTSLVSHFCGQHPQAEDFLTHLPISYSLCNMYLAHGVFVRPNQLCFYIALFMSYMLSREWCP